MKSRGIVGRIDRTESERKVLKAIHRGVEVDPEEPLGICVVILSHRLDRIPARAPGAAGLSQLPSGNCCAPKPP
jgi:hypothetical protein